MQTRVSFVLLRVEYVDGEPEGYLIPMAFGDEEQVRSSESLGARRRCWPGWRWRKAVPAPQACSYDAFGEEDFSRLLWEMIATRRRFHGGKGTSRRAGRRGRSTACGCTPPNR